jgi:YidC/Oxa1 family membrane protein insertase
MTVTADRNQRLLALGLPFVFTIFVATFPAGLLVYWITTNVWTIGQQYLVKKRVGTPPQLSTAKAAPAGARALGGASPSNGDTGSGGRKPAQRGGGGDREPAPAEADGDAPARATAPTRATPPPRPPRKKKKRSGRRR